MLAHFTKMAVKALLRFKLHSAINFLSLGFGFICFITALLLANYLDSFDQHWPNADRVYNVVIRNVGEATGPDEFPIVNEPAARYLRSYFPEIPNIVKASIGDLDDITIDGQAHTVTSRYVEDRFFNIFPVEYLAGIDEGSPLPPNSAVITEQAAMRLYNRVDVVGERLLIDNESDVAIVAVAKTFENPSHLDGGITLFSADFFFPMEIRDDANRQRRIAAGVDPDADQWANQSNYVYLEIPEDMDFDLPTFHRELDEFVQATLPEDLRDSITYELIPVNQLLMTTLAFVTAGFSITTILLVAGILVLLIGCLNYSNLVIAQLSLRSQEIAVEKILGSKRGLLIAQYCFESFLFVLTTLVLVFLVMAFALSIIGSFGVAGVGPEMLANSSLWIWLLLVVVLIVLIAGCYPALRTVTVPLISMMRPKGSGGYSGRLRAFMVGTQFFISGTLMILAFVMFEQNATMTQQLDGDIADPKLVVSTAVDTFSADYDLVKNELQSHPGVLSVSQVDLTPWSISSSPINLSRSGDLNETTVLIANRNVGYDYESTMDVSLLAGRNYSRDRANDRFPSFNELRANTGPYSILLDNRAAQALGFDNAQTAVGQSIYRHLEPPSVEREIVIEVVIVGAIDELKYQFVDFGVFGITGDALTLAPEFANLMVIKISKDNVNDALSHIDETWSRLMPDIPLQREFVDNLFYLGYNLFLSISVAIAALSILGFLIASIGLLGNATFITNIRQKEVGIRKVMGASSSRLLRMLLLDFAKPILIANAIAWPVGYLIGNVYISLFAARAELTVFPFLFSLALSAAIAIIAVASQSWKSARVRPAMILRYE
ncbi:MAG: FtsX-like permease family protein [Pseudomonadales bacterium]|nr:FtsX-like permease family protein [Pseudomonadales bacterium]